MVFHTPKRPARPYALILALALLGGCATDAAGQAAAVPSHAAPDDGGPRNWEVRVGTALLLRAAPSVDSAIAARYRNGTILDNLGCEPVGERVWCDVQELGGGPRGYVAAEFLRPAVAPDGVAHYGPDDSALRAGQGDYDASGAVRCRTDEGPTEDCSFRVSRSGGGYATVLVDRPDGGTRAIYFRMGIPIGADLAQADGDMRFTVERRDDVHLVRAGRVVYEIVDAVVLGG